MSAASIRTANRLAYCYLVLACVLPLCVCVCASTLAGATPVGKPVSTWDMASLVVQCQQGHLVPYR